MAAAVAVGQDELACGDFCARPTLPLLRIQQSLPGQPGPAVAERAWPGEGDEPVPAAAARECRWQYLARAWPAARTVCRGGNDDQTAARSGRLRWRGILLHRFMAHSGGQQS